MQRFDNIIEQYFKFSERNDFVPYLDPASNSVTIYYSGNKGLQKGKALSFSMDIECSFFEADTKKIYELMEQLSGKVEDMDSLGEAAQDEEDNILTSSYNEAPVIKLVNQIIIHAVKTGASDIHFEGRDNAFLVRLRVDGILNTFRKYPKNVQEPVIARIKVIASMDVSETRRTQDGRINLKVGNRTVDIRVSCMPSVNGEKAVLRILERTETFSSLDQSGMNKDILLPYKKYLSSPNGIILVTGPTGSGKTTTLYASLLEMNRDIKNIITIEDPVEYHIDNITQVQVNPAAGIIFSNAVRAFLRQDPDIILIGEIRDQETAEAAVQASLTGHLVLSTLHTNDAPTAVSRLIEMNVEPFLLSSSLLTVLGQRLVRKICPVCKVEVEADSVIKNIFTSNGYSIEKYMKGQGCEHCFHTGYRGRTGLFELLSIDDNIRKLINNSSSAFEIKAEAKKYGYRTMFQHGTELIYSGVTTPEEVLAAARSD